MVTFSLSAGGEAGPWLDSTSSFLMSADRAASSDATVKLTPPRVLSLEQALEFIADDECVEVTPVNVRLRKVDLDPIARARRTKALKAARTA